MGGEFAGNGYMCMYGWIPLLFSWNYHNFVNQLYPNKKIESLKKITYFTYGTCYFLEQSLRIYIKHATNINVLIFISLARELPYDLAIPLPGIYSEKTIFQKVVCISMFIVTLFIIASMWKQSKYPLTDEWIKIWYICIQLNITQSLQGKKLGHL